MQAIESYQKAESSIRLLLQGPPKSGKTCLACHFPKPYVIDIDVNLGGPLAYLRGAKAPLPVGYDVLDRDEAGKEVPIPMRYLRLGNLLVAAATNPLIETIIIDSATTLSDLMMAEVLRQQSKSAMDRQLWGFFFQLGKKFCSELSKIRKHVILVCHERMEKDELDQSVKFMVAWPGQLGDIIGAFFTDVWRCEVAREQKGMETLYHWNVRTMPDHRFNLGGGLKLSPVFEFKWPIVEEALKKVTG